jgi:hypothetical protein
LAAHAASAEALTQKNFLPQICADDRRLKTIGPRINAKYANKNKEIYSRHSRLIFSDP